MIDRTGRAPLLLALGLLLTGCPTTGGSGSGTSGNQTPDPDPQRVDPPTRVDPPEADCPEPVVLEPTPTGEPLLAAPDLAVAVRLHDDGDLEGALAEGYAVLDGLQDLGIDSLSLRLLLGTWALEAGDGLLAEEQFEIVLGSEGTEARMLKKAMAGLSDARAVLLGPEGAALADARDAIEWGDLAEADRLLSELLFGEAEQEVIRQAEDLRGQVTERAIERADAELKRAEDILSGPGPYDLVVELLDEVKALPEGTWDRAEERRLRAWYRSLAVDQPPEGNPAQQEWDAILAAGRSKVASTDYREALALFAKLDGTPLQQTARAEARGAADVLVKEERQRAATLFVAAKKKATRDDRVAAMVQVRELLASLAAEFPDSSYAERVTRNLSVVEDELRKEGWEG
ncbi:MAG: hypothetical protein GY898_09635 [Proteobacteria bacterium]|nr:hypothetical protein [Pseudomonadota bacterium]